MSDLDVLYGTRPSVEEPAEARTAAQIEHFARGMDFLRATVSRWTGGTVRTSRVAPRGMVIRVAGVCREAEHRGLMRHGARH